MYAHIYILNLAKLFSQQLIIVPISSHLHDIGIYPQRYIHILIPRTCEAGRESPEGTWLW